MALHKYPVGTIVVNRVAINLIGARIQTLNNKNYSNSMQLPPGTKLKIISLIPLRNGNPPEYDLSVLGEYRTISLVLETLLVPATPLGEALYG